MSATVVSGGTCSEGRHGPFHRRPAPSRRGSRGVHSGDALVPFLLRDRPEPTCSRVPCHRTRPRTSGLRDGPSDRRAGRPRGRPRFRRSRTVPSALPSSGFWCGTSSIDRSPEPGRRRRGPGREDPRVERALGEGENVITLQPAAVLEGRVVSASEPTCVTATGETSITLTSTAEAGGAFRIPGLDRGIWRVDGRLP